MLGRGLGLAAIVVAADQATKWWLLERVMNPPRVIEVTGFFDIVLAWNTGISFSLFDEGVPPWAFAVVAGLIVIGLGIWLWRTDRAWLGIAIGLVIGGAIGNVIDRLRFGAVVDFLYFHAGGYGWPAFNLADSAITIGVVILLIDSLFDRSDDGK